MRINIFAVSAICLLTAASSFALEAPTTCPEASALSNPGFVTASNDNGNWTLFTQSAKFGTTYDWSLGTSEPVAAATLKDALKTGNDLLKNAMVLTPNPVEFDESHYACGYGSGNMIIGTITPALETPPATFAKSLKRFAF